MYIKPISILEKGDLFMTESEKELLRRRRPGVTATTAFAAAKPVTKASTSNIMNLIKTSTNQRFSNLKEEEKEILRKFSKVKNLDKICGEALKIIKEKYPNFSACQAINYILTGKALG
jgi:hypothetical protein